MRRRSPTLLLLLLSLAYGVIIAWLDHRRRSVASDLAKLPARPAAASAVARERVASNPPNPGRETTDHPDAIAQAQKEIDSLEQHARTRRAEIVAAAQQRRAEAQRAPDAFDPVQGMTRLERFQNVGRETPMAAFQTLVWAAMHGEQQTLNQGLALDEKALQRAHDLIAGMPEQARASMSPQQLAALWFQLSVLDAPAARIVGVEAQDATHVVLRTRGGVADSSRLTFVRGNAGWQLVVPQHGLEVLQQQIAGTTAAADHP